jgi:hypothetical protein
MFEYTPDVLIGFCRNDAKSGRVLLVTPPGAAKKYLGLLKESGIRSKGYISRNSTPGVDVFEVGKLLSIIKRGKCPADYFVMAEPSSVSAIVTSWGVRTLEEVFPFKSLFVLPEGALT